MKQEKQAISRIQKIFKKNPPVSSSQFSDNMRAIMPEFKKWRDTFFRLDCILVGITFLIECILFFYLYNSGQIKESLHVYLLLYLIIPTFLNLLLLLLAVIIRKRLPQHNLSLAQNALPVLTMVFISMVISTTHCAFYTTLCIFCIPISMTTVFSNKALCRLTTVLSIIGVIIATVKHFFFTGTPEERFWMLPEGLIIICILMVIGLVSQTLLDMTDGQKQKLLAFAKTIKEEQSRAETANIAKSAFLANMSHEIRTPINAILGMNEMILRENKNGQITDYAQNIYSAGNSLLSLVNDVLDISKIESGKLEIIENTYETSSLIHDCYNMIIEKAEKKGLDFHIDCDPNIPSHLKGDEVHFRQIVTNILSNAAKYTEKGSITMSVYSHWDQNQFFLVFSITDTGIGIKKKNLENLFSQFSRFDLEKNRNIEGTGLGLAITKQLVDLMYGEIQVESEYGAGSTFTVTIPQQIIDITPMGDYHKRYRDVSHKNMNYHQSFEAPDARILVVDDVEVNLKVIVNLLKETKVQVDTALSGRQCLAMVTQNAYDLIFMDHMMPEMNGVETYTKMKELKNSLNKDTPVIMLTANAISGVREQYLQVGFTDYLSKPILGDRLEKIIIRYLPSDKLQLDVAAPKEEFRTENIMVLQKLFQYYPQADLALGLSYCRQNSNIYLFILQSFGENSKTEELNHFYEKEDAGNYLITIHEIKSSALNIGFSALAEKALALEDAIQKNDWNFVLERHPAFLTEYRTSVNAILKALN